MQQLGRERQVLAVTHLAQVAACAHQHLVVSKAVTGGQTSSDIRPVASDDRVKEIARMLGGAITDTSRAHAQAMLQSAREHDQVGAVNDAGNTRSRSKKVAA
jgi:DNA repair protein RecN (Recombination protein N)